jgi:site-specific recombinase XerD
MNNHPDHHLEGFSLHLKKNFEHPKTRRDKLRYVKGYLDWLITKQHLLVEVNYNTLLDFIGHLQGQGKAPYQINRHIKALEDYHAFKKINFNAHALRIRSHKKTLRPLLESKGLEAAYEKHQAKNKTCQLILSLVIWQALEYEDIVRMETRDIELDKGQVYIKSRRGRNARYLALAPHQVMQLHGHIEGTKDERERTKTDRLLIGTSKTSLYTTWKKLSREVKKQANEKLDEKINDLRHLRQSRLAIWVHEKGLRQAQYMSGYKSVAGIERYRSQSTRALREQLDKCHPWAT